MVKQTERTPYAGGADLRAVRRRGMASQMHSGEKPNQHRVEDESRGGAVGSMGLCSICTLQSAYESVTNPARHFRAGRYLLTIKRGFADGW